MLIDYPEPGMSVRFKGKTYRYRIDIWGSSLGKCTDGLGGVPSSGREHREGLSQPHAPAGHARQGRCLIGTVGKSSSLARG